MRGSISRNQIQKVSKSKRVLRTRFFSIRYMKNELDYSRIGFSFSRKRGSAVLRNRFKRRLRAIIQRAHLNPGYDFLITATRALDQLTDSMWSDERSKIGSHCESL